MTWNKGVQMAGFGEHISQIGADRTQASPLSLINAKSDEADTQPVFSSEV